MGDKAVERRVKKKGGTPQSKYTQPRLINLLVHFPFPILPSSSVSPSHCRGQLLAHPPPPAVVDGQPLTATPMTTQPRRWTSAVPPTTSPQLPCFTFSVTASLFPCRLSTTLPGVHRHAATPEVPPHLAGNHCRAPVVLSLIHI